MTDHDLQDFLLEQSRIPPRYQGKTLNSLGTDCAEWITKARGYVDEFDVATDRPGLFIHSTDAVGVGKTHLACSILKGLIYTGRVQQQVSYYRFSELIESLAADDYGRASAGDDENLRRLSTSEVILWDDVDKFVANAAAVYRLHRVVDRLWGDGRPTLLVTSNCDGNGLSTRLNDVVHDGLTAAAIVSRIAGLTRPWKMIGSTFSDFRLEHHDRSVR